MAPEASEHPTNPMTTLGQVDNDQAGEDQTYVGMDGVPDMQELQGPQGSSDASQEAKVDEPTRFWRAWRATGLLLRPGR